MMFFSTAVAVSAITLYRKGIAEEEKNRERIRATNLNRTDARHDDDKS